MARAIAMITRIDFTLAECATSTQASYIARKMDNFVKLRTTEEFEKKFAFYGMFDVAHDLTGFVTTKNKFEEFGKSYQGVAVQLTEV